MEEAGTAREASAGPGLREIALAALACGVAAAALYGAHVVRGGWYLDDWTYASKLPPAADRGFGDLVETIWNGTYRPGYALILLVMYLIGGTGQAAYLALGVAFTALEGLLAYVVARQLRAPRLAAASIAALLIALPTIDATRLWMAAFPTTWAMCLYLFGVALAIHGLRGPPGRRAVAWHAAALTAYLLAVLTSELLASVVPLTAILYWWVAGPRRALPRFAADLVVAVAPLPYMASRASDVRPTDGSPGHVLGRIRPTLEGAKQVFLEGLPFSNVMRGIVGVAVVAIAAAGVALAIERGGEWRSRTLRWLGVAAGATLFALAGLVLLLPAGDYYVPKIEGLANRLSAAAALGEVVLLVALAWLVGIGVATLARRPRVATPVALVLVAVTTASMVRTEVRHQRVWAQSWTESQKVQGAIRNAFPTLPRNSAVVTFRHNDFLPPEIPVFGTSWDLRGAVRYLYDDQSLEAQPFNSGFTCDPDGMRARSRGAPEPIFMPYGDLYFVDVVTFEGTRVVSRRGCNAWRVRLGV